jgi:hypothetical protein
MTALEIVKMMVEDAKTDSDPAVRKFAKELDATIKEAENKEVEELLAFFDSARAN